MFIVSLLGFILYSYKYFVRVIAENTFRYSNSYYMKVRCSGISTLNMAPSFSPSTVESSGRPHLASIHTHLFIYYYETYMKRAALKVH